MHASTLPKLASLSFLTAACLGGFSLLGCTTLVTGLSPQNLPAGPTTFNQNWQFNTGATLSATGGNPGLTMAGALQIQGSQVTGVFKTTGICFPTPYETLPATGTFSSTTGALSLTTSSATLSAQLAVPTDPTRIASGTIGGFGQICALAVANVPAVGAQIPPLAGTFTGPLTGSAGSVVATLTVSQAATANTDGDFPLAGTLQYTGNACTSAIPVTGSITGITYIVTASTGNATLTGFDTAGGSSLPAVTFTLPGGACNSGTPATFTGTLTRQ